MMTTKRRNHILATLIAFILLGGFIATFILNFNFSTISASAATTGTKYTFTFNRTKLNKGDVDLKDALSSITLKIYDENDKQLAAHTRASDGTTWTDNTNAVFEDTNGTASYYTLKRI